MFLPVHLPYHHLQPMIVGAIKEDTKVNSNLTLCVLGFLTVFRSNFRYCCHTFRLLTIRNQRNRTSPHALKLAVVQQGGLSFQQNIWFARHPRGNRVGNARHGLQTSEVGRRGRCYRGIGQRSAQPKRRNVHHRLMVGNVGLRFARQHYRPCRQNRQHGR